MASNRLKLIMQIGCFMQCLLIDYCAMCIICAYSKVLIALKLVALFTEAGVSTAVDSNWEEVWLEATPGKCF